MIDFSEFVKTAFRPVRRKLMGMTIAYLAGVYAAAVFAMPEMILLFVCAFLAAYAFYRHAVRRSALFYLLILMFFAGNLRAGHELSVEDWPTSPGVWIEGTVSAIEKPYRVYLSDVRVEGGEKLRRAAVLTLMQEESEEAPVQPKVGQRVQGKGRLFAPEKARNPGGYDRRIQAICKGYELSGYLLSGWSVQGEPEFSIREWFRGLRTTLLEQIAGLFGDQAALFQGIMLGDKSGMDSEVTAALRLTGTVHILTVSGLHLSAIAGLIGALLRKLPVMRRVRFALHSTILLFFTYLTGGAAGTIRALIMALLRAYAAMRGRRYEALTALSAAALAMTLYQPLWAFNASFQFSFFVVLGIQLFERMIREWMEQRISPGGVTLALMETASVSMSAQVASVPMQLLLYGYVPLLSLPMNMVFGSLMPLLMLGGWCTVLLSYAAPGAAAVPARALMLAAQAFERVSLWAASLEGGILRLPSPTGLTVIVFALLMCVLSSRIRFGRRRVYLAVGLTAMTVCLYLPRFDPAPAYVQLDVGQGDAAVFRFGRQAVVVDAGPADSYELLRYLRHEGLLVQSVVLSHPDEDHIGGLGPLLASEISLPEIISARGAWSQALSQPAAEIAAELARRGIALHEVERGYQIRSGPLTMDVLSPDETLEGSNERSLLIYARLEDVRFLLTGDLPMECEPEHVPPCDVLKVAHHGSKSSTSDAFLGMASPSLAMISVGADNRYGHPTQRVLDSLERVGADILRTDESGCITLRLHQGEYTVKTHLKTAQ